MYLLIPTLRYIFIIFLSQKGKQNFINEWKGKANARKNLVNILFGGLHGATNTLIEGRAMVASLTAHELHKFERSDQN